MNLYLFAIGGSGSRVLRSLTMLLASGVQAGSNIIPIIIDPDTANGDLDRAVSGLRQYEEVRSELSFDDTLQSKFFSTNITSLNNDGNYLLPLIGTSGINFDKYLALGGMSQENQAIAKMLFSNNNMSSTMDVGFKGNPNIGSIVLNQFTQSKDFKNFEANFVNGDKVFIISSIFGGTGASGFPLILKTLRTSSNSALASAPIGAVSLLPYFNLKKNTKSAIQADSFITKSKAALHYYEKNVTGNSTLNDMYYLGDDFSSQGYDNCDGGTNQSNDAHFIEFLGALAILDFDGKQFGTNKSTSFHEFGLNTTPNGSILFSDLGHKTNMIIRKPLTMMAILNSYLNNRDEAHRTSQKWAKDRDNMLGSSFFSGDFFSSYTKFKEMYESWIEELERNQVSFSPFNEDKNINHSDGLCKVKGIKPSYPGINPFRKKGFDLIDIKLDEKLSSVPSNSNAATTFMEVFFKALSDICKINLNIQ